MANQAILVCLGCRVRVQCDEFGQRTGVTDGVWAGQIIGGEGNVNFTREITPEPKYQIPTAPLAPLLPPTPPKARQE